MPGEDGYALLRRVRELEATGPSQPVPAIAVTAFARPEDRSRSLRAGFRAHLSKPVDPAELAAAIATLAGDPDPGRRAG